MDVLGIPINTDPQDLSNMVLPDPDMAIMWKGFEQRTIYIEDELAEQTISYGKLILIWNQEDEEAGTPVEERKPIRIMIDSPGGYLADALYLARIIKMSKTPVYTYNLASSCSGAFLLLIAGHKRFAMPGSVALYHSGSGQVGGSFSETMEASKNYKRMVKDMEGWVLQNTTIPRATLTKKSKTDWYMDTDEQVKYGVIDKVIDSIDEIVA